jgi:hypothetical protein
MGLAWRERYYYAVMPGDDVQGVPALSTLRNLPGRTSAGGAGRVAPRSVLGRSAIGVNLPDECLDDMAPEVRQSCDVSLY